MLSSNLLKSNIPHLWGGGSVVGGRVFTEFDAEFKFAKIQNSHLWGEGEGSQNLMLSSNFLKTKIPICGGGGGGVPTFDAESKFALKKKNFFCEEFSKFSGKNWNVFVLGFEYRKSKLLRMFGNAFGFGNFLKADNLFQI